MYCETVINRNLLPHPTLQSGDLLRTFGTPVRRLLVTSSPISSRIYNPPGIGALDDKYGSQRCLTRTGVSPVVRLAGARACALQRGTSVGAVPPCSINVGPLITSTTA